MIDWCVNYHDVFFDLSLLVSVKYEFQAMESCLTESKPKPII